MRVLEQILFGGCVFFSYFSSFSFIAFPFLFFLFPPFPPNRFPSSPSCIMMAFPGPSVTPRRFICHPLSLFTPSMLQGNAKPLSPSRSRGRRAAYVIAVRNCPFPLRFIYLSSTIVVRLSFSTLIWTVDVRYFFPLIFTRFFICAVSWGQLLRLSNTSVPQSPIGVALIAWPSCLVPWRPHSTAPRFIASSAAMAIAHSGRVGRLLLLLAISREVYDYGRVLLVRWLPMAR